MASSHRWVVCRISFPACLLKRHFWLPDETVVNFTLSEPWASRRREALCASASSFALPPPPPVLSYPCPRYVFFHTDTGFQNFAQRSLNDSLFRAPCVHYAASSQRSYPDTPLRTPAQACAAVGWWLSVRRARHARSVSVQETILLGAEDGIPLYDTSLALKVANSWGQGGRGSLPGGDVVLVTTCTETNSHWLCSMEHLS